MSLLLQKEMVAVYHYLIELKLMYYMLNIVIQQLVWVSEPGMEVLACNACHKKNHEWAKLLLFYMHKRF